MTTDTMNTSDRQRKTLASQLDRLDGILDALSEGLNEAVANAVQHAVGLAVQHSLTEVLTNEQLLEHLRQPAPAAEPPKAEPGLLQRIWNRVKEIASKAKDTAVRMYQATRRKVAGVVSGCRRVLAAGVAKVMDLAAPVVLPIMLLFQAVPRLLLVGGMAAVAYFLAGRHLAWAGGWLVGRLKPVWARVAALMPPWEVSWAPGPC
jgi:hypothetical protein